MGKKSGVEVVKGYVWVQLYCTLLKPHVQQYKWEVQPDQQLSNPPLPPQPWPQLPEPPPQCQVLQQHAQEIKVICLKWIVLWCTIIFLLEMEMDSVLEIFPFLTVFPLWRTSLPSSPWTGSSAQRLRKVRIALVRGVINVSYLVLMWLVKYLKFIAPYFITSQEDCQTFIYHS